MAQQFVLSILEGLEGWPTALFIRRARRPRSQGLDFDVDVEGGGVGGAVVVGYG